MQEAVSNEEGGTCSMQDTQQKPIPLKTAKILAVMAGAIMQRHGCLIEEGRVILPAGSTRTPREQALQTMTIWYDLVLPDGYQMLEAYDRRRELSISYVPPA